MGNIEVSELDYSQCTSFIESAREIFEGELFVGDLIVQNHEIVSTVKESDLLAADYYLPNNISILRRGINERN